MLDDLTPSASSSAMTTSRTPDIKSPEPPPGMQLSEGDLQVYDYICARLRDAGIEHMTAGMPILMIVRTYGDWIKAYTRCEKEGRTQTSPRTGWTSSTPWADDEKRLKMELGQWLPKACLTIPSLTRVRKDTGAGPEQDDLFADLLAHARGSPGGKQPH